MTAYLYITIEPMAGYVDDPSAKSRITCIYSSSDKMSFLEKWLPKKAKK